MIPQQVGDSLVPIRAGLLVSLVNEYILSNPKFDACCTTAEPEEPYTASDSNEYSKPNCRTFVIKHLL